MFILQYILALMHVPLFRYRAPIQKVLSLGFLADEGKEEPNTTKSGLLSAHQQNATQMFRWWADFSQTLNAGLVAL